jgi:hypothetical protein
MGARVELEILSIWPNNKAQGTFTPTLQVDYIYIWVGFII